MNKKDVKIDDVVYWNTTGAYQVKISLKCKVLDIGKKFIWILVYGNLGPTPVKLNEISTEPLSIVTNINIRGRRW